MTDEQFAALLSVALTRNREERNIEFKGPYPRTDRPYFAKVVRAMLGMSNNQGGGLVILGVDDNAGKLTATGLSEADWETWRNDDVAAGVAIYADPSITFELETRLFDGRKFVVIQVTEFDAEPVLCKKAYNYPKPGSTKRNEIVEVLRDGACYVRSRRKPETIEIPSYVEMRELLDLATTKALQRLVSQLGSAGIALQGQPAPSDYVSYEQQLDDLLGE